MKPILFNTEMVKAILESRKTQTRRPVKGLPLAEPWFDIENGNPLMCDENGDWYPAERFSKIQPDDILWVRETWNYGYIESSDAEGSLESWFEELRKPATGYLGALSRYFYLADKADEEIMDKIGGKWRPSIHMPKDAARLFLRVKDVRMERLQDMSEEDAISEGYSGICHGAHTVYFSDGYAEPCHVGCEECYYGYWYCNHSIPEAFGRDIWDGTIKPAELPRYGWEANPWVWVITFERTEP